MVAVLRCSDRPLKAKDIAQKSGVGQSRADVNRYLYYLQTKDVLKNFGNGTWMISKDVEGMYQNLDFCFTRKYLLLQGQTISLSSASVSLLII